MPAVPKKLIARQRRQRSHRQPLLVAERVVTGVRCRRCRSRSSRFPALENPGAGPSTPLNVPLMRVDVMLVMMTDPLLPGPSELHVFASTLLTNENCICRVTVGVLPSAYVPGPVTLLSVNPNARAVFDEFTITRFPGDPEIVLMFACTKARVVRRTVGGGRQRAAGVVRNRADRHELLHRKTEVALRDRPGGGSRAGLLEAVTMKLNVPAISVDESDVMVIEPSAPVMGLDQPAVDTASTTDPPGTCGPTPSG